MGYAAPELNAPAPQPSYDAALARQKRAESVSFSDAAGAIWRQDGLIDGVAAELAANGMEVDPSYNVFQDPAWEDLTKGVSDEFIPYLYSAHSAAHARFLKDRLLQKQDDLAKLDTLGFVGNVGRFAMNAAMPESWVAAVTGGIAARGVVALRTARAARGLSGLAGAELSAGQRAAQAAAAARPGAVGAGVGLGAAENAAYEYLRQRVNFEDDSAAIAEAGLLGAAFTAPFALAGARAQRRIATVAEREHQVLKALKDADEGKQLTPEQGKLISETKANLDRIDDLISGRIDTETYVDSFGELVGPVEPPDVWMKRYGSRVAADAQEIIERAGWTQKNPPVRIPRRKAEPSPMPESQAELAAAARQADAARAAAGATPVRGTLADQLAAVKAELTARKDAEARALAGQQIDEAARTEKQRAMDDAFAAEEAKRNAEIEAAYNQRELQDAEGQSAQPAADTAPVQPVASAAPAAPTAESFVGRTVRFLDKNGEDVEGKVEKVSPTGRLLVRDPYDGNLKAVAHTDVDLWDLPAEGSGFLKGSVGSGQIAPIENPADALSAMNQGIPVPGTKGKVRVPVRLDFFSIFNRSESLEVRRLGYKLVKDAIQNSNTEAQPMTASERRTRLLRTIGKQYHHDFREAVREARKAGKVPMWKAKQFNAEFSALVSRLGRGDQTALEGLPPGVASQVKAAQQAMRKALDGFLAEAKRYNVKGAADIPPNENYVPRVWHHGHLRDAEALHGKDSIIRLIADSIRDTKYANDPEVRLKKAASFYKVVRRLEFNDALDNVHLLGRDMGTLRQELDARGLTPQEIDEVVDTMFEVKENANGDSGQAAQLRFRFDLDETVKLETKAGVLRLSDLLENDSRILMDRYGASMAGHAGMASVGFDSVANFNAAIKRIMDDAIEKGLDTERVAREVEYLKDVHRNILGKPMSTADFSYTNRAATAVRGYTRSVMLGQLGVAAAFEMKQAIALMGMRAFIQQMPTFRGFLTAIRQGHLPDEGLSKQVRLMTGWGNEMAASYARDGEIESGMAGGALTRFERFANTASHATDVISGNSSFTSLTRQVSARMAMQNFADFAHGRAALDDKLMRRWVGQGIDKAEADAVLKDFKAYTDMDGDTLAGIRYEDWQLEEPETYDKFMLFVDRQVRDSIQDQDVGETMPFMHTTLGKMFAELKTFFLVAHAKNFLKNAEYRDMTALQVWMIGFMGEALAYSMQTSINYPGDTDRLSPDRIALGAFSRMSAAGFLPFLIESGHRLLTGESFFQEGSTTNTDVRSLVPPSLVLAGRAVGAPATGLQALLGTDVTTSKEFKDAVTTLPLSNTWGVRALVNWFADGLPKSDPSKLP